MEFRAQNKYKNLVYKMLVYKIYLLDYKRLKSALYKVRK